MELHERIYQLRKEKNMTQQDLAEKLNVSRQAVSRWEMGTAKPELDSLTALSQIFGITVDELLKAEEIPEYKIEQEEPVVRQKKHGDAIWWIIWAVSIVAILALSLLDTSPKQGHVFVMINPVTVVAQIANLALINGIVVLIIRWLWRKGKQ